MIEPEPLEESENIKVIYPLEVIKMVPSTVIFKVIKKYRNNKILTHEHTPFFLILSLKPREPFPSYQLQEQFCYSQPNKLDQY